MAAYSLGLTALLYSHPLGLLMAATLGLASLLFAGLFFGDWRRWLACHGIAVILAAPWLPHYFDHSPEFLSGRLPIKFLLGTPIGFIGGNSAVLLGLVAPDRLRDRSPCSCFHDTAGLGRTGLPGALARCAAESPLRVFVARQPDLRPGAVHGLRRAGVPDLDRPGTEPGAEARRLVSRSRDPLDIGICSRADRLCGRSEGRLAWRLRRRSHCRATRTARGKSRSWSSSPRPSPDMTSRSRRPGITCRDSCRGRSPAGGSATTSSESRTGEVALPVSPARPQDSEPRAASPGIVEAFISGADWRRYPGLEVYRTGWPLRDGRDAAPEPAASASQGPG